MVLKKLDENLNLLLTCILYLEKQPSIVFCTEDGRLLLVSNCDKRDLTLSTNYPHANPIGLKELLSAIHDCSEELTRVNQFQDDRRKLLNEIACAAHLLLNEKGEKLDGKFIII